MRRLVFLLTISLGGAAVLIALGTWQVQRLSWKQAILADIERRVSDKPVALPETADREADKYLPVTVTGRMGPQAIFVLVSQKQIGAGYRVISDFTTDDGRQILLDRGFVRVADRTSVSALAGKVTVTGNLHWPDEIDSYTPAPDLERQIWFARDVDAFATALNTDAVLVVAREMSLADGAVTPLPVDTSGIPNNHLQYAITWFSLAFIWVSMSAYFTFRGTRRS